MVPLLSLPSMTWHWATSRVGKGHSPSLSSSADASAGVTPFHGQLWGVCSLRLEGPC